MCYLGRHVFYMFQRNKIVVYTPTFIKYALLRLFSLGLVGTNNLIHECHANIYMPFINFFPINR